MARNVVLAAGVLGTTRLLLRLRASAAGLPRLPAAVGRQVRTNSEVLLGVVTRRRDRSFADGVAITSILRLPDGSAVEPVRYPEGSGFFRLLVMPHAPGSTVPRRLAAALGRVLRQPAATARALLVRDYARHSLILLYMRAAEGTLALELGRWGKLGTRVAEGQAPTAALPEATAIAEDIARRVDGYPVSLFTEVLFGTPTTAHILGGCIIAETPQQGVVDAQHRVFEYPGLFVVDGSAVPANPGVNPSLTITAMAERAVECWERG
jgi:cholesterol oxidase